MKMKVLVVDDIETNLMLMKYYLSRRAVDVFLASSSHIALDLFRKNEFALVFLDLSMPQGLNGYELLLEMRDWEHSQGQSPTYIIALTAGCEEELQAKVLASGFNELMLKSSDFDAPLRQVDRILDLQRRPGLDSV